jgi:hypothetical protein
MPAPSWFFVVTALLEVGAGAALLAVPSVGITALFGSTVDVYPASAIARLTGAALVSIGAACWWARNDTGSGASQALLRGVLVYNVIVIVLVMVGTLGALAPLQWTAVVVHVIQAAWCARLMGAPR